jgi:hypothetical protein
MPYGGSGSEGDKIMDKAIHSANFDDNKSIDSTSPDHFITTECVAGISRDTVQKA